MFPKNPIFSIYGPNTFIKHSFSNVEPLLFQFLTVARLTIHMTVGVLTGLIYYQVGNDAAHVFDNFGLLYFCIMFLMFTAFSSMILTCK